MWMVKTTHKEYPLAYLKSWALGHEREKEPARGRRVFFFFVGSRNVGTTNPGTPSKRRRYKK